MAFIELNEVDGTKLIVNTNNVVFAESGGKMYVNGLGFSNTAELKETEDQVKALLDIAGGYIYSVKDLWHE